MTDLKKDFEEMPNFRFIESVKPSSIINEINLHSLVAEKAEDDMGLFDVLPAAEVLRIAQSQQDPVQLYPCLLVENELAVLFADTGVGKTVLAFQIAIHVAKAGYTTLYLDLELSRKQFQKRLTGEDGMLYSVPDNLYRVEFKRLKKVPVGMEYEGYFFSSLAKAIKKFKAKIVVLDNLTKLAAGDTDSAKAAIPILERLNDLKFSEGLTILVLEHNKKVDTSRPIQLNDLQGSKMKSNLVDAVFTIGKSSKDKNLRYIKQLKVRDGEVVYDTENVKVCELSKISGYLSFTDVAYQSEFEHLKQQPANEKTSIIEQVKELSRKGNTQRQIATELQISLGTVNKYLKK